MSKRHHNDGFSLIEVMCAILIMGVALVALTRGITTALGSTKDSEVQTTVVTLAAGQIETLRAGGVLTDGTTDGDFGNSFPKYEWEQTVSPGDLGGLHQVDVVVKDSKSGSALFRLSTLLFDSDYPSTSVDDAKRKQRDQDKAKKRETGEGAVNLELRKSQVKGFTLITCDDWRVHSYRVDYQRGGCGYYFGGFLPLPERGGEKPEVD